MALRQAQKNEEQKKKTVANSIITDTRAPMDKTNRNLLESHKVMTSNVSIVQKVFNYDKWKLELEVIKRDTELINCENKVH